MKEKWNSRFAGEEYIYGTEPNEYFRQELVKLPRGRILLPAEGEGRNSVHALREGWTVKAFDFSDEGRRKAMKLAAKHGVELDYQIENWQTFSCRFCDFDVVGLFFFHLPTAQRRYFHEVIYDWLKPGGSVISEFFSKKQLGKSSGGPQDPDLLYSVDELQKDFEKFTIVQLEELKTELNEGQGHKGESWVIRFHGIR
jgi:2-polyprenyl-3-methyl-5-hydroxy-6-metoxy-1,4-benzoquinol methylase